MNTRAAGWYDDPQDTNLLRYWDGVTWTEHTSPRQKPGLEQAGAGQGTQYGAPGAPQDQQGYGPQGQQGQAPQYPTYGSPQYGAPQDQQSNPYGQQQGGWGQPMPGGVYTGTVTGPTTPDGQPIAGWGMRFLARILDGILVALVGGALAMVLVPDVLDSYNAWFQELSNDPATPVPADLVADIAMVSLVIGGLALIYEVLTLKFFSASLGKLATGLRVRLRDEPGALSWSTAAIRGLVWQGPGLLSGVPGIGNFVGLFNILNGLWPLWDAKKQSLNDKIAKTNVVKKQG